MCHSWARVVTVSLSSSDAHSDGRENDSCGMVAGSGPLAPREGGVEGNGILATQVSNQDTVVLLHYP
jgi:hypothetical protein